MAESEREVLTFRAGAALNDSQAVIYGSGNQDVLPSAAGTSLMVGVVDEGGGVPTSGQAVRIVKHGRVLARAGAVIAVHAIVTGEASGKIVTATTGDYPLGQAEAAAGADGDLIQIFVDPSPNKVAA